ncbi:hypothetical protein [Rubrivivax gelatinosus]|nr:hypothetical protein [Rubrivivax gelatinosus]
MAGGEQGGEILAQVLAADSVARLAAMAGTAPPPETPEPVAGVVAEAAQELPALQR